jgi:hypothetical protein
MILIQYNSILYYLYAESTENGQLQTQHSLDAGIYIIDKNKYSYLQ